MIEVKVTDPNKLISHINVIVETDQAIVAEINFTAEGKHKEPTGYCGNSVYFPQDCEVSFLNVPFRGVIFAETSSGVCFVCMSVRLDYQNTRIAYSS